jgi:hypothetical protein
MSAFKQPHLSSKFGPWEQPNKPSGSGPITQLDDEARSRGFAIVDVYAADAARLPFPSDADAKPRYDELVTIEEPVRRAEIDLLLAARRHVAACEKQHQQRKALGGHALQPLLQARSICERIEQEICGPTVITYDNGEQRTDDPGDIVIAAKSKRGRKRHSQASDRIVAALVSFPYSAAERGATEMSRHRGDYRYDPAEIAQVMVVRYGIRITPREVSTTIDRIVVSDARSHAEDRWLPYFERSGRGAPQKRRRLSRAQAA